MQTGGGPSSQARAITKAKAIFVDVEAMHEEIKKDIQALESLSAKDITAAAAAITKKLEEATSRLDAARLDPEAA